MMVQHYQELLALEERIGNVNTGLSEETILQLMNQRKYQFKVESASNMEEPCCICQVPVLMISERGIRILSPSIFCL